MSNAIILRQRFYKIVNYYHGSNELNDSMITDLINAVEDCLFMFHIFDKDEPAKCWQDIAPNQVGERVYTYEWGIWAEAKIAALESQVKKLTVDAATINRD